MHVIWLSPWRKTICAYSIYIYLIEKHEKKSYSLRFVICLYDKCISKCWCCQSCLKFIVLSWEKKAFFFWSDVFLYLGVFKKNDFLWKFLMCKIFFQNVNSIFWVAHCIFLQSLNIYKLSLNWNLHVCCIYIIQVILALVQFHSLKVRPRSYLIQIRVPKSPAKVY